jgi:integrase
MTTQNHPPARGDFRRVAEGLYQYESSGAYYARFRHKGERIMERLGTKEAPCASLPEARRLLRDLKNRLDRTDVEARKKSLLQLLNEFENGGKDAGGKEFPPILRGAPKTLAYKKRHLKRIRKDFPAPLHTRVADIKKGDIRKFLAHYNDASAEEYNHALTLIRDIFRYAVDDEMVADSPVEGIKYRKREDDITRLIPSWEEFTAIVGSIRGQRFADTATESADLIEFMGLAGLGQAECAALKWGDINFHSSQITTIRRKTRTQFEIPIYPQLRPLLTRMNEEREEPRLPTDAVFSVKDAKKALDAACKRLALPSYSSRAFRRMFITRCIEVGIDVQKVADWQGHKDGGALILKKYARTSKGHGDAMAALLTTPITATNVIPIGSAAA